MKYTFIAILVLISVSSTGQVVIKKFGPVVDNIQTHVRSYTNGSDSVLRIAAHGVKVFKTLKIGSAAVGSPNDSTLVWNSTDSSVRKAPSINSVLSDSTGYHTITVTTTDATPANIATIVTIPGYAYVLEATAIGIEDDGNNMYQGKQQTGFIRSASSGLFATGATSIVTDKYAGTGGLSTATFSIISDGDNIAIQVTGEASTTILWKVRYQLLSTHVSF